MLRARHGSGTASIPAGNRKPGLPEQQLFAQLAWSPAFASRVGSVFTAQARHTGRMFVNDGNGRFFEPSLGRPLSASVELSRRF